MNFIMSSLGTQNLAPHHGPHIDLLPRGPRSKTCFRKQRLLLKKSFTRGITVKHIATCSKSLPVTHLCSCKWDRPPNHGVLTSEPVRTTVGTSEHIIGKNRQADLPNDRLPPILPRREYSAGQESFAWLGTTQPWHLYRGNRSDIRDMAILSRALL